MNYIDGREPVCRKWENDSNFLIFCLHSIREWYCWSVKITPPSSIATKFISQTSFGARKKNWMHTKFISSPYEQCIWVCCYTHAKSFQSQSQAYNNSNRKFMSIKWSSVSILEVYWSHTTMAFEWKSATDWDTHTHTSEQKLWKYLQYWCVWHQQRKKRLFQSNTGETNAMPPKLWHGVYIWNRLRDIHKTMIQRLFESVAVVEAEKKRHQAPTIVAIF